MNKGLDRLQKLIEKSKLDFSTLFSQPAPHANVEVDTGEGCICTGGNERGHFNDLYGYCCEHFGNTCGFDHHLGN